LEIPHNPRDFHFSHRVSNNKSLSAFQPERRIADLHRIRLVCSCEKEIHRPRRSAIQLKVKTILNRVQHFVGFIYQEVRLCGREGRSLSTEITVQPHECIRGRCSQCQRSAPGYDRLPERHWLFVPLWGIPAHFLYAPRRVQCSEHGVVVEHIPWSDGSAR
jgi:hypothetical protein